MFVAPSTVPTTLYLLEKYVTQSSSVFFSVSSRSDHSGLTSLGFVEVLASALDASWPAKTVVVKSVFPHRNTKEKLVTGCTVCRHRPSNLAVRTVKR